jgi:hypothetical protein
VRIYLPSVAAELSGTPSVLLAHAVTEALRAEVTDEDDETLEMIALLAAADDSVRLVGERGSAAGRARRVVLAADVPDSAATPAATGLPTAVELAGPVDWSDVRAIHVDETDAETDVAAAAAGDDDAFERVVDLDLLWYDPAERDRILPA